MPASISNRTTRSTNGDVNATVTSKGKKSTPQAIDPSEVHEMVQNRIAALEGEKVQGGEEDKRSGMSLCVGQGTEALGSWFPWDIAEEARKTLKGMNLQQLHAKYVELVSASFNVRQSSELPVQYQDFRRQEREHTKERQKNKKEADACERRTPVVDADAHVNGS